MRRFHDPEAPSVVNGKTTAEPDRCPGGAVGSSGRRYTRATWKTIVKAGCQLRGSGQGCGRGSGVTAAAASAAGECSWGEQERVRTTESSQLLGSVPVAHPADSAARRGDPLRLAGPLYATARHRAPERPDTSQPLPQTSSRGQEWREDRRLGAAAGVSRRSPEAKREPAPSQLRPHAAVHTPNLPIRGSGVAETVRPPDRISSTPGTW